jgi:hypothetical protein
VAFARAEIEPEMITDPLLPAVGWSWLSERCSPATRRSPPPAARYDRDVGGFGGMAEDGSKAEIEIRASWTRPATSAATAADVGELAAALPAGLPPLPPGVVVSHAGRRAAAAERSSWILRNRSQPEPPAPPKPVVPPLRLREPLPAAVDTAAGSRQFSKR